MINIDVLLKAAEFLESQLILNSDASSSSSSTTSDVTLQATTINNCGYNSSSSSSGYSSTESNERTSTSSTASDPIGINVTGLHLNGRYSNSKSAVTNVQELQTISTNSMSSNRRNAYQAKRLAYGSSSKSKLKFQVANDTFRQI
jgi:hypothetical protein